eukprot:g11229.t1
MLARGLLLCYLTCSTAAGQNRVAGVAWVPSSQHRLRFGRRALATLTDEELRRKMEEFNDMFVTAREELEYAEESKDTTYFDEDAAGAKEAVEGAVALFEEILDSVEEDKRTDIMRSSGLRVEQLKAELDQVLVSDDH